MIPFHQQEAYTGLRRAWLLNCLSPLKPSGWLQTPVLPLVLLLAHCVEQRLTEI